MKLIQDTNYQKPLLQIEDEMSIHYNTNIENQIPNSVSECVICGKGIKATSKNYSIVAGLGNYHQFIHKDEWDYAESKNNTDGGFMGTWDIGSECYKKLKDFPNIKNYIKKNF